AMRAGVKAGLSWHGIYFAFTLSFVNLIFYQRPHLQPMILTDLFCIFYDITNPGARTTRNDDQTF
ncbi:MAG: hypothetical protein KAV83_12445, partial [Desulfobacterales bacterium]|nr:hypothetical protein [Desulfobacterales bacterium]